MFSSKMVITDRFWSLDRYLDIFKNGPICFVHDNSHDTREKYVTGWKVLHSRDREQVTTAERSDLRYRTTRPSTTHPTLKFNSLERAHCTTHPIESRRSSRAKYSRYSTHIVPNDVAISWSNPGDIERLILIRWSI